jgi:hypothetical protein
VAIVSAQSAQAVALGVTEDLRLWLRADKGVTIDTVTYIGRVLAWDDELVGDNTIANDGVGPSGHRPIRIENEINGLPVIRFDSGNRYINGDGILTDTGGGRSNNPRTMIVVARHAGTGGNEGVLIDLTGNGGAPPAGAEYAFTRELAIRVNGGNRGFDESLSTAQFDVVGVMTPGPPSNNTNASQAFRNSPDFLGIAFTGARTVDTGLGGGYRIGDSRRISGTGREFQGDIAEIIVFEDVLSEAERNQVGYYLQEKYALSTSFTPTPIPGVDMTSLSSVTATLPPASIVVNQLESDTDGFLFIEQEDYVLTSGLDVNVVDPGTYTSGFDVVADTIPAGQLVNSYYLSFDPEDDPSSPLLASFSLSFNDPIIGIITGNTELDLTDAILGAAGTTYLAGNAGLENNAGDLITISPNRLTLSVTMQVAGANVDQIRVLTAFPEPASASLLLLGALLLRRRRRA